MVALGPGLFITGTRRQGSSAVVFVGRHRGADIEPGRDGLDRFIRVQNLHCWWLGVYSAQVLANGWSPYDQPDPAAYLPFEYAELQQRVRSPGAILWAYRRLPRFSTRQTGNSRNRIVMDFAVETWGGAEAEALVQCAANWLTEAEVAPVLPSDLPFR